jgi:hypothetical protein
MSCYPLLAFRGCEERGTERDGDGVQSVFGTEVAT